MVQLDAVALEAILSGFTHYIGTYSDMTTVIYFQHDQHVFAVLPGDERRSGTWGMTKTGFFVQWSGRGPASWAITSAPSELSYVNADGKRIGVVSKIVAGDAEQLASHASAA